MARAMKICAEPGCPNRTHERRCPEHKPKPWSTHGAGEGRGRPWRRRRWECFVRDDFTCVDCAHRDPTAKTLEADHIGPTDELHDLATRCKPCHARKTLGDAHAARTGTA